MEMELNNLLISKNSHIIAKLLSMLSTSKNNRNELVKQLLIKDPLNIGEIELENPYDNYNKTILDVYLKSIGLKILRKKESEEDI